jgi:hypothetical protein
VEEAGRILNARDSVFGTRVSGLIGATGFADLRITGDSGFGFLDLKFATWGEGGGWNLCLRSWGHQVIGSLGFGIRGFGGDQSRE